MSSYFLNSVQSSNKFKQRINENSHDDEDKQTEDYNFNEQFKSYGIGSDLSGVPSKNVREFIDEADVISPQGNSFQKINSLRTQTSEKETLENKSQSILDYKMQMFQNNMKGNRTSTAAHQEFTRQDPPRQEMARQNKPRASEPVLSNCDEALNYKQNMLKSVIMASSNKSNKSNKSYEQPPTRNLQVTETKTYDSNHRPPRYNSLK